MFSLQTYHTNKLLGGLKFNNLYGYFNTFMLTFYITNNNCGKFQFVYHIFYFYSAFVNYAVIPIHSNLFSLNNNYFQSYFNSLLIKIYKKNHSKNILTVFTQKLIYKKKITQINSIHEINNSFSLLIFSEILFFKSCFTLEMQFPFAKLLE